MGLYLVKTPLKNPFPSGGTYDMASSEIVFAVLPWLCHSAVDGSWGFSNCLQPLRSTSRQNEAEHWWPIVLIRLKLTRDRGASLVFAFVNEAKTASSDSKLIVWSASGNAVIWAAQLLPFAPTQSPPWRSSCSSFQWQSTPSLNSALQRTQASYSVVIDVCLDLAL